MLCSDEDYSLYMLNGTLTVGDGYWYILDDICSSQCKKKNGIRESKKTYPVLNI